MSDFSSAELKIIRGLLIRAYTAAYNAGARDGKHMNGYTLYKQQMREKMGAEAELGEAKVAKMWQNETAEERTRYNTRAASIRNNVRCNDFDVDVNPQTTEILRKASHYAPKLVDGVYVAQDYSLMRYFAERCDGRDAQDSSSSSGSDSEGSYDSGEEEVKSLPRVTGYSMYVKDLTERLTKPAFAALGMKKIAEMWMNENDEVKAIYNSKARQC
jgi:hypothetical protein